MNNAKTQIDGGRAMVRVEAERKKEIVEVSQLRVQRQVSKMEQAYAERERSNMRFSVLASVPTGDPPSIMLWGED